MLIYSISTRVSELRIVRKRRLLRDDTIGEVLEDAYSAENPEAMYRLADSFTSDRNDQSIETLIDRLYDYSRVHPVTGTMAAPNSACNMKLR